MEKKFTVISNEYLDCVSKSEAVTQGIIKAKKCQVVVTKGTFNDTVVIQGINGDKVGYEFNAKPAVAQAIIDFFCDDASSHEIYECLVNGLKYDVRSYPSGKTIATVDIESEEEFVKPKWLGEEITE